MDKKTAQHINMTKNWMFLQLADKQLRQVASRLNSYEKWCGFGLDDDYDEREYTRFTKTDDGFKKLWDEHCKALDEWRESLDRFCNSMVRFTDGQIDYKTARTMATNPRYAKKLDKIMMGER